MLLCNFVGRKMFPSNLSLARQLCCLEPLPPNQWKEIGGSCDYRSALSKILYLICVLRDFINRLLPLVKPPYLEKVTFGREVHNILVRFCNPNLRVTGPYSDLEIVVYRRGAALLGASWVTHFNHFPKWSQFFPPDSAS